MVHGAIRFSEKKVVTLWVPNSTRRSGVKQWMVFKEVHVVFSDVRVVFSKVRVEFGEFNDTYSAYPLSRGLLRITFARAWVNTHTDARTRFVIADRP